MQQRLGASTHLSMKQTTEKQHYVPKFYLKRFTREGQIQVLNVKTKRIGKPRPYGSVCYEKFFYGRRDRRSG